MAPVSKCKDSIIYKSNLVMRLIIKDKTNHFCGWLMIDIVKVIQMTLQTRETRERDCAALLFHKNVQSSCTVGNLMHSPNTTIDFVRVITTPLSQLTLCYKKSKRIVDPISDSVVCKLDMQWENFGMHSEI